MHIGRKVTKHLDDPCQCKRLLAGSWPLVLVRISCASLKHWVIAVILSLITNVMPNIRKYINGTPAILMDNGTPIQRKYKEGQTRSHGD